jgi:hypothetical protein
VAKLRALSVLIYLLAKVAPGWREKLSSSSEADKWLKSLDELVG